MVTEPGDGAARQGSGRAGRSEPADTAAPETRSTSGPETARPTSPQPAWTQVWPPWTYWVQTTLAVVASPAAVILSTLAGGILAGFAGALLALPIAATIKVIAVDVVLASRSNPAPDEATPDSPEPTGDS